MLPELHVFALPLKHSFRGVSVRDGVLFEGPNGWAEFAPFHDHTDEHAGRWLTAAIEQAYGEWPALVRRSVPVNAIVPVADPGTTRALVEDALASGITTIKTKVGANDFDDDVARVAAIREALDNAGVDGAIRIDTNQQWTLGQAIDRLTVLDAIADGLEYVEQPVADIADLQALRRAVDVRIAVDESIRLAADPAAAIAAAASVADVIVLKSIPLGGVGKAQELADRTDLPVVVSGSLDSRVGLTSGLWLAGTLMELPFACGLATHTLFAADVAATTVRDGEIDIHRVTPSNLDPASLVTDELVSYWRARFERAWKYADTELMQ